MLKQSLFIITLFLTPFAQAAELRVDAADISKFIKNLKVRVSYQSTVSSSGCLEWSAGEQHLRIFVDTYTISNTGGILSLPATISKCSARLASVLFDAKQNKDAIQQQLPTFKAAAEMERFDLTKVSGTGVTTINAGCKVSGTYVAGHDDRRGTLYCAIENKQYFDPTVSGAVLKFHMVK